VQQQSLCATMIEIRQSDLMPTDTEISNMKAFVEAMQPIVEITEIMGKEKKCFVFCCSVLPPQTSSYPLD